jgi:Raf kinase inhibitor-like YbhB/YbcL family protein
MEAEMKLTSTSFSEGQEIPVRHTCDGENVAPDLAWSDLPPGAQSLALVCFDPDAPSGTFTHWTVWDLDPSLKGVPEGQIPRAARQGVNGFGQPGYGGPCPPRGHGVHHYHFQLSALRQPLDIDAGASQASFTAALRAHEIERAEPVGVYERR